MKTYNIKYKNKSYSIKIDNEVLERSYKLGRPYELPMLKMLEKYQVGTFVDIGAHVGNHTVFLSHFGSFDNIVSFEPNSKTYSLLMHNVMRLPDAYKVSLINTPLSSKERVIDMTNQEGNDGSYGVIDGSYAVAYNGIKHYSKTLDSFKIENIKAIKIDVEGHEPHVLVGAQQTIKKQKPHVYIEMTYNQDEIRRIMNNYGYRKEMKLTMGSRYSVFT